MTAMAARTLGYDVRVLDPERECPARHVANETITAPWADADAARALATGCAAVTLEIEQIPRPSLEAAAAQAALCPPVDAVHIVQERARQKEWLAANGFPLGPFRTVRHAATAADAVAALGPSIVKSAMGGYDGRGQVRVRTPDEGRAAFERLAVPVCVVEAFLDIATELSVLVARRADGEAVAYPTSRNVHTDGVLTWAVTPSGADEELERRAQALALGIAERLGIVGLLATEMFVLRDGTLLVNELAPRPHNTFHHSERAHPTSQFEQLVRAICHLPLGATAVVRPAAIHNLLGDLWAGGAPDFTRALAVPGVRLHLYGKTEARPGRKMGHLSADGDTPEEALDRVLTAYRAITS
ncbi:MAG: 5-(carboxyamino)imidazole ribonucleotide synthase [Gemmatimonadaceae bacterium]|nr:5-(carboxyamino)imidazole ribonucleotide synthase [Gemmatimonadaceae bacterium]